MYTIKKEPIHYQYKMCRHCQPSSLLSYQLVKKPEGYDYMITEEGYEKVWDHEHEQINIETIRGLLKAIAKVIMDCQVYMLDFQNIVLDEGRFYKRDSGGFAFEYLPFYIESDLHPKERIESWLALIHEHMDVECEKTMSLLHPLNIALAAEKFTLQDFANTMTQLVGDIR